MNEGYYLEKGFDDYIESEARLSQDYMRLKEYDQAIGIINRISIVIFIIVSIILIIKKIKHKKIQKYLIIFWIISIIVKMLAIILASIIH